MIEKTHVFIPKIKLTWIKLKYWTFRRLVLSIISINREKLWNDISNSKLKKVGQESILLSHVGWKIYTLSGWCGGGKGKHIPFVILSHIAYKQPLTIAIISLWTKILITHQVSWSVHLINLFMGESNEHTENNYICVKTDLQLKSRAMAGLLHLLISLSSISCISVF